jgi:hypothetical protein
MVVLTAAGMVTATVAAALLTGLAGATEDTTSTGLDQTPAQADTGSPQPAVRPATTWYSDWSTRGSSASGMNCDPMALRWC